MLYNQNCLNVAKIASKSEVRPELAGVFFTKDKVVATDSFKLLEMTTSKGYKVEDYPDAKHPVMKGFKPFIIPAKELSKVKIPKNKSLPVLENVAVSYVDDKRVDLMTTDLETADIKSFRRIDAKYPDYEKVFPTGEAKAEINISAEYLIRVLEVMGKVNNLGTIKIKFYSDQMPLVLEAKNDNQSARAMVMPLRK